MNEQRPSPEALLKTYHQEEGARGKLKIFLGAAPGVGKTYAMLGAARMRQRDGINVLVGIVETHGRSETAELLADLTVLPRLQIHYRDKHLEEMDLDAILAQKPQLVLVDELAHTNLGECRHPKRYLDVEEILAAGIDVYTTVNIQHLESLNDAVAQITHIRVQETVPDSILEKADSIELIDLPPEELHQRLREGKVYVPERAALAIEKYFRLGNLSALRELALRFTAEHVDEQMQTYRQAHAIRDFWPTTERLIVSVGPGPYSARLIRATKRMAENRNAEWIAVYIETPGHYRLSEEARNALAQNLNLAEQLGAEVASVAGDRIADTLVRYARERNATEIVIGKSLRTMWHHWIYGSIVHDVIAQSEDIDVCVITAPEEAKPLQAFLQPEKRLGAFQVYLWSMLIVVGFALFTAMLKFWMDFEDPAIFFLTGVLLIAFYYGLKPALLGMLLSISLYNFFFIPPYFTFTIASSSDLLKFIIFTILGVVTSNLAARSRSQEFAAKQQAVKTAKLYQLSRELTSAGGLTEVLQSVVAQVSQIVGCQAVLLLPEQDTLVVQARYPESAVFQERDVAVAVWAFEHGEVAGHGSNTLPGADWFCMPLQTDHSKVGVIGIRFFQPEHRLGPEERRLLNALVGQAVLAIERAKLVSKAQEIRMTQESERLYHNLLSSVSHELRTPLTAIQGSLAHLKTLLVQPSAQMQEDLQSIGDGTLRLKYLVANLLDITRLEAGYIQPKLGWYDLSEVIHQALEHSDQAIHNYPITMEIPSPLPLVHIDFGLIEQVLINLFHNIVLHTPSGTAIRISVGVLNNHLQIRLEDSGPGIAPALWPHLFDKFYRGPSARSGGTGLGLSICKGFIEAHQGTIAVSTSELGGACFTILLPLHPLPEVPPEEGES